MISRIATMVVAVMLVTAAASSADSAPAQSQPASKTHVALIEPEVLADFSADQRKAIAWTVDMLLTESLGQRKEFVLVDRAVLDRVLAEKASAAGGIARLSAADVAEPLRPFWAAGVIVCPTIRLASAKTGEAWACAVEVDAVVAQTGQVVAQAILRGAWRDGKWVDAPKLEPLAPFWSDIQAGVERSARLPLVEVSPGILTSSLTRLRWMRDDLDDFLRNAITADGRAGAMTPRHPLFTKEERLLRVMGLSAAREGDKSAGLVAAADAKLVVELVEDAQLRITLDKTPLEIRLTWQMGEKKVASEPVKGTVGEYDSMRQQALKWIKEQLGALPSRNTSAQRDLDTCRRMAKEEWARVKQLMADNKITTGMPVYDTALCRQALSHAMQAAHLDPTNKDAARQVALLVECLYVQSDQEELPLAAHDRKIAECLRYTRNFKMSAEDAPVYFYLSLAARAAAVIEAGSAERFDNLTLTPLEGVYRYARIGAQATLDYALSPEARKQEIMANQNLWIVAIRVRDWVMLNCPLDELDSELAYWRERWKKDVASAPGDKPPFEVVLVGYYARKRDPAALRDTYSALAKKCPSPSSLAWKWAKTDLHLKVAGDPDWKTWQPEFPKDAAIQYRLDIRACDEFFARLNPPSRGEDAFNLIPISATRCEFPTEVLATGYRKGRDGGNIEALAVTDKEIWFVTPVRDYWSPSTLFVCPLAEVTATGRMRPKPIKVDWPDQPTTAATASAPAAKVAPIITCALAVQEDSAPVLWVGTKDRGLARFEKSGETWKGRFYADQQGAPVNNVSSITPVVYDGRKQLLVGGLGGTAWHPTCILWLLDPSSGGVRIFHDGAKTPLAGSPGLEWADGARMPLAAYDARTFPKRDLKDAKVVNMSAGGPLVVAADDKDGAMPRLWRIGSGDKSGEVNIKTLDPIAAFKPRPVVSGSVFVSEQISNGHARMMSRNPYTFSLPGGVDPFNVLKAGVWQGDMAWMIDATSFQLWGYVPAPAGDKDWAQHDQCVGPFVTNGGGPFESLLADGQGHLFVTSMHWGVERIDVVSFVESARKNGRLASTAQIAAKMFKVAAPANWQQRVARAILEKHYDDALAAVDEQLATLGAVTAASPKDKQNLWSDLMLWQGLVQARAGYLDEASDLYLAVADSPLADGPAKSLARLNRISLLYMAKRWQAMLDEVDVYSRQFPGITLPEGMDRLNWHVADARKKKDMAATQPSLGPVDTHTPRRPARVPATSPAPTAATAPADAAPGASLLEQFKTDKAAAFRLLRERGAAAIPGLVEGLRSSDADTRLAAATLLRGLGAAATSAIKELVAMASQDTSEARNEAFIAFSSMGPAAKEAVPLLMEALRTPEKYPRGAWLASGAMMRISPDEPGLGDILLANVKNTQLDRNVRLSNAAALNGLKAPPEEAASVMLGLLKDPSPDYRTTGIAAVKKFAPKEKRVALLTPLIKDEDKMVRVQALQALREMGPDAKDAIPDLVAALKDPENWVKESAAYTLAQMGKAARVAIPDLKALKNPQSPPRLQEVVDTVIRTIDSATE